jgi:hypothetical protein
MGHLEQTMKPEPDQSSLSRPVATVPPRSPASNTSKSASPLPQSPSESPSLIRSVVPRNPVSPIGHLVHHDMATSQFHSCSQSCIVPHKRRHGGEEVETVELSDNESEEEQESEVFDLTRLDKKRKALFRTQPSTTEVPV